MSNANRALPNLEALNPTELKALIVSQHELIVSRDSEIEQLKLLIAKLRRMQFGRSSEKLDRQIEQLELRLEALQQNDAEMVAATPGKIASVEPVGRSVRRPLPTHLSREVRTHLPKQQASPDCGGELRKLGEDISEVLERIPSRLSSDPACSCEAGLRVLRPHCTSRSAKPSDRAWHRGTRTSGPRAGLKICRASGRKRSRVDWHRSTRPETASALEGHRGSRHRQGLP